MIALCDRFPGLDPIKLRATPALEYFRLVKLYKNSSNTPGTGATGSNNSRNVVIRREVTDETATGGWF